MVMKVEIEISSEFESDEMLRARIAEAMAKIAREAGNQLTRTECIWTLTA